MWKPATSAWPASVAVGCPPTSASESAVRLVARVERIASPRAPPICCDVLRRPDARPASPASMPLVAISVTGTNVSPIPIEIEHDPGQEVGEVVAADVEAEEEQHPDGAERHADDPDRAQPDRPHQRLREAGADHDPEREGDERKPGLDRRVAEHALHVERVEVEHREEAARRRAASRGWPSGSCASRKISSRTSGSAERRSIRTKAVRSTSDEQAEPERVGRQPALLLGLDDPVDERDQARGDGDRAGDVEGPVPLLVLRLRHEA